MSEIFKPTRQVYRALDHIRIQDRLVELDILNDTYIFNIYSKKNDVYKGIPIKIRHPDFNLHRSLLVKISKAFANKYFQIYKKKPDIKEGTRTNIYEIDFYHVYGDSIIKEVFNNPNDKYFNIRYGYNVEQCMIE